MRTKDPSPVYLMPGTRIRRSFSWNHPSIISIFSLHFCLRNRLLRHNLLSNALASYLSRSIHLCIEQVVDGCTCHWVIITFSKCVIAWFWWLWGSTKWAFTNSHFRIPVYERQYLTFGWTLRSGAKDLDLNLNLVESVYASGSIELLHPCSEGHYKSHELYVCQTDIYMQVNI